MRQRSRAQRAQIGRWREKKAARERESMMIMYRQLLARMPEVGVVDLPRGMGPK